MSRIYGEAFATVPESLLDGDVSDRAIRLWCVLARLANQGGRAYPGRPHLAERLRCSVQSVDRAMDELREGGWVVSEPTHRPDGSRSTNNYFLWPRLPSCTTTGDPTPPHQWGDPLPPVTPPPTTGGSARGTESQVKKEPQDLEPVTTRAAPPMAGFEAFWKAYPRRTAKGSARASWAAALKAAGGDAAVIVAGAQRYRDDPNRDDAYTAHAATWLRAERWTDDPLPPRNGNGNGHRSRRPGENHMTLAQRAYDRALAQEEPPR